MSASSCLMHPGGDCLAIPEMCNDIACTCCIDASDRRVDPTTRPVLADADRKRLSDALVMARSANGYVIPTGDVAALDAVLDALTPVVAALQFEGRAEDAGWVGGRVTTPDPTTTGTVLGEEARRAVGAALVLEYVDPEENLDGPADWQNQQADDAADAVLDALAPHFAALLSAAREEGAAAARETAEREGYERAYTEVYEEHCRKVDPDLEGYGTADLIGHLLSTIENRVEEIDPAAAVVLGRVLRPEVRT